MDMDTHGEIKIVKVTGPGFEKCLAVHIKSDFSSLSTWELDGFHHSLYASGTWLNRWLDLRRSHGHSGYHRVLSSGPASSIFFSAVASGVFPC